jgi:coniferyl-aldehyde dehydrogenase
MTSANVLEIAEVKDACAWAARREPVAVPERAVLMPAMGVLEQSKGRIVAEFAATCGYGAADAEALWGDQMSYLAELVSGEVSSETAEWIHSRGGARRRGRVELAPYESTAVALPSNAPVPLAAVLAASAGVLGARTMFMAPRLIRPVVAALLQPFVAVGDIALAQCSTRELLPALLDAKAVDHLYFLGSSDAYADLAARCAVAGASLTFEGQGNGIAVVSRSARGQMLSVARRILESKRFCNGRMCSSPSLILVVDEVADDLTSCLSHLLDEYVLDGEAPLDAVPAEWRAASERLTTIPETHDGDSGFRSPVFVVLGSRDAIPTTESFSPIAGLLATRSFSEAVDIVQASPFRLQVSYFGHDRAEMELLRTVRFARYCFNIDPADQDPLAPWGNFGRSGTSRVVTFLEKFRSPVLVEEADLE